MPLITVSVKHNQTFEEARNRLETVVQEVRNRFQTMIRHVEWSADRSRVRFDGTGFWVEIWIDAQDVHVTGDLPLLGRLLGDRMVTGVQQIVERTFQKKLP